jgi:phosphatidylserine/phosphatidylglycerophosphate/cardiolipin synthase-like enzyme
MRSLFTAACAAGFLLGCTSGPAAEHDSGDGDGPPASQGPDGGTAAGGGDDDDDGCPIAGGPAEEAVFTSGGGQPDLAIEDRLVALIEAAEPEAQIRASFAYLDQRRVADTLIDAHKRGVDVRVVLDERNQVEEAGGWHWNGAVASLIEVLGADRVIACGGADSPPDGGGCIAREKQHNAFLLVSSTCDGSSAIVAQTSAYLTKAQLSRRDNLVVIRGDDALHAAYLEYWRDLARQNADDTYYRIIDGDKATRLFLFPRASSGGGTRDPATDTIYNLLHDNVVCAGGTRVRLAMSYWSTGRGYLVDQLDRMAGAGCDVRIVANPDSTDDAVASALRAAFDAEHLAFLPGVHHKYLLVDGSYGDDQTARLVWTGTQDFTASALRSNDEVILRLDDAAFHDRFLADWNAMFSAAAPPL